MPETHVNINEIMRTFSPALVKKVNKLFTTKRATQAAVENLNSTIGLFAMIQGHFKPDFEMVEVGSFEGTSTLMFALFTKKVYSVDCYDYTIPPTGRIPSMDKMFVRAEKTFLKRTKNVPNIVKVKKTSIEAARDFADQSLDAVYIDAEHDEDNVRADVKAWTPKIKKGGFVSGHDYWLPHIQKIVKEEFPQGVLVYSDTSWITQV